MDDNKGTSIVFVHSNKAKKLFDLFEEDILVKEVDCEQGIVSNSSMIRSSISIDCRKEFIKEINGEKFDDVVNKDYIIPQLPKPTVVNRIKAKIKSILNK